jgi:hypothetical protein
MAPGNWVLTHRHGTAAGGLEALAEALFRPASDHEVAAAIECALAAGGLTPAGDTLFVPAVAAPAEAVPASWRGWLARGYLPLRVRYCAHPPPQVRTLAGILASLDDLPELHCVPQHLAGHWLASLHLPDVSDLRDVLTAGGYDEARWVHAHCLGSLGQFAAADSLLRNTIQTANLPPAHPFPVAGRYRWAVDRLGTMLGTVDLPAALPEDAFHGPSLLFCDPKPANFLVPQGNQAGRKRPGRDGGPAFPRIDLELMCYETPLALQIVLALYAQPVSFHRPGGVAEQFTDLRSYAHEAAAGFGVSGSQLDAMLAYHLLRNFVSAAGTRTPAGSVKARSFARLLACAIEQLPCVQSARHTRRLLQEWIAQAD